LSQWDRHEYPEAAGGQGPGRGMAAARRNTLLQATQAVPRASRVLRVSRIEHIAAPLCRITFVTPSRTAHASVASTAVGRDSGVTSIVLPMPAAASAARAPASAEVKVGCR